jgi:uncharacterized small protein (DUF1192 family)
LSELPGAAQAARKPVQKSKVDGKVAADQRGHGPGVSLGVYAISDLDQRIAAVTKLESDVLADSEMIRKKTGDCGANAVFSRNGSAVFTG